MKTKPLNYQEKILILLNHKDYHGITWEMGIGKTWVGIHLMEKNNIPALIICPVNVMETWRNEIIKHSSLFTYTDVCMLVGAKTKRAKKLQQPASIYIINYEGLRVLEELKMIKFGIIILDEAHRIKNHKAITTKKVFSLTGETRYVLTGTPLANSYLDVYTLCYFLDEGKLFGTNFYAFRNKYFYDTNLRRFKGNYPEWVVIPQHETELKDKLKSIFHRLEKKDVLPYLPPKIYKTKYCYMNFIQENHYKELKNKCITFIDDNAVVARVALIKIMRLNQLTSGFMKDEDGTIHKIQNNPKQKLLLETVTSILTDNGTHKIIIWAHFRHDIEMIYDMFEDKAVRIYGGMTAADRYEAESLFQNDDTVRILVGNPSSAGEGLTLTAANYAIYYSMNYSMIARLQSEDRCHRKGSEIHSSITYIDLVMKDTVDEIVLQKVDKKIDLAKRVMQYIKEE